MPLIGGGSAAVDVPAALQHAVTVLQYRFHVWTPVAHAVCTPGACRMNTAAEISDCLSVCSRDARNVHWCTASTCRFRVSHYKTNDVVCGLTTLVVSRAVGVADFVPQSSRLQRFNVERQVLLIRRVLVIVIESCRVATAASSLLAAVDVLAQVRAYECKLDVANKRVTDCVCCVAASGQPEGDAAEAAVLHDDLCVYDALRSAAALPAAADRGAEQHLQAGGDGGAEPAAAHYVLAEDDVGLQHGDAAAHQVWY